MTEYEEFIYNAELAKLKAMLGRDPTADEIVALYESTLSGLRKTAVVCALTSYYDFY